MLPMKSRAKATLMRKRAEVIVALIMREEVEGVCGELAGAGGGMEVLGVVVRGGDLFGDAFGTYRGSMSFGIIGGLGGIVAVRTVSIGVGVRGKKFRSLDAIEARYVGEFECVITCQNTTSTRMVDRRIVTD
jgi:hypothetical protein